VRPGVRRGQRRSTSSTAGIRWWKRCSATSFVPNDLHAHEDADALHRAHRSQHGRQSRPTCGRRRCSRILAQIGSFVPARSMTLGMVDRIFTRIGAGDDLASGQSTFYVEMAETSNDPAARDQSQPAADRRSRARHGHDRRAPIAQAICEYLARARRARGPMVLFATHFHELTALAATAGRRRQLPRDGGREHRAPARRSSRTACCRAAARAPSASKSRAWPGFRPASSRGPRRSRRRSASGPRSKCKPRCARASRRPRAARKRN
jgi:hypothetical protein